MMLDFQAAQWLVEGTFAGQTGNDHSTGIPSGIQATADRPVNILAVGSRLWQGFCEALDRPDGLEKPQWPNDESRSRIRQTINAGIEDIIRERLSGHWLDLLDKARVLRGPIDDLDEVFATHRSRVRASQRKLGWGAATWRWWPRHPTFPRSRTGAAPCSAARPEPTSER